MSFRNTFRVGRRTRLCRTNGCDQKVGPGAAYCRTHNRTAEAVAFRRELQGAEAYLELAAEALDPDQLERAEAFQRFKARAKRGQFDRLLEAPTRRMLEQAAAVPGFDLEIGALRFGLMKVLTEETDPTRMSLALARLSNAGVRARGASREEAASEATEAAWLDRVSEAMIGYTLEGAPFSHSSVGYRAGVRQRETPKRWEEAKRIGEETRRREEERQAWWDAEEAAALERDRQLWREQQAALRTPSGAVTPIRAAVASDDATWSSWAGSAGRPAESLPPLPVGGEIAESDWAAAGWATDEEDRADAAVLARMAGVRAEAVRIWERDQAVEQEVARTIAAQQQAWQDRWDAAAAASRGRVARGTRG